MIGLNSNSTATHRRARLALPALIILSFVACGSPGGGSSTTSTTDYEPPAPGTVTLDLSGVTGATNLVMLSVIGDNLPTQPVAALCAIVGSDDFSFSGRYLPITGDDPCTLGSEPVEFNPGSYNVIVAALPGGSTTPEQCTQMQVSVDGDVTVRVTSLGPPDGCELW